jgi:hypothetical protein
MLVPNSFAVGWHALASMRASPACRVRPWWWPKSADLRREANVPSAFFNGSQRLVTSADIRLPAAIATDPLMSLDRRMILGRTESHNFPQQRPRGSRMNSPGTTCAAAPLAMLTDTHQLRLQARNRKEVSENR